MAKKTVKKVVRRVRKSKATAANTNPATTNVAPVETVVVEQNTAPVEVVVTASDAVVDTKEDWEETWSALLTQTSDLAKSARTVNTTLKKLHKQWSRSLKDARKQSRKRKSSTKRAPSGFAKPSVISAELCTFLGKPAGTEMARTEVTRLLTEYIKEHALQDPANKRKIVPDARLTSLLQVENNAELTYFNLQKYMKRHFPKTTTATSTTTVASATA